MAIGDVHGDFSALKRCLEIAGVSDENEKWIGGTTHLVQLGDILDRGDSERSCIDLLFALKTQARAAGGEVHILLGNHELMNVDRDFRYVTPGAWTGWSSEAGGEDQLLADLLAINKLGSDPLANCTPTQRERATAFLPGGFMARRLARMPVAVHIGDTLLVHAGVRLAYARYGLDRINAETAAWLRGRGPRPQILDHDDSPLWVRQYSVPNVRDAAERELEQVLRTVGAQRMVVGHTPQVRRGTPPPDNMSAPALSTPPPSRSRSPSPSPSYLASPPTSLFLFLFLSPPLSRSLSKLPFLLYCPFRRPFRKILFSSPLVLRRWLPIHPVPLPPTHPSIHR